jgi:hypothetical protein
MTVLQWFLQVATGRFAAMQCPPAQRFAAVRVGAVLGRGELMGTDGDGNMVRGNRYIAAGLAAGLALSVLATPSFAQRAEDNMSSERAKALQDCSKEAGKMSQSTWGVQQLHKHRSCMMQRGHQQE